MELIERLQEYRLRNRISQKKLGKMLGVTFATINRWENGHGKPNKISEYHIRKLLEGDRK